LKEEYGRRDDVETGTVVAEDELEREERTGEGRR
jgi:hypothetical protein